MSWAQGSKVPKYGPARMYYITHVDFVFKITFFRTARGTVVTYFM